MATDEATKDI